MENAAANDVIDLEQDLIDVLGILRRAHIQSPAFGFWRRCAEQVIQKRATMQRVVQLTD